MFDQRDWWVTPEGDRVQIAEMSRGERRSLAAWLVDHHRHFYLAVLRRELVLAALAAVSKAEEHERGSEASDTELPGRPIRGHGSDFPSGRDQPEMAACESDSLPGHRSSETDTLIHLGEGRVPRMLFTSSERWMTTTPLFQALTHRPRFDRIPTP